MKNKLAIFDLDGTLIDTSEVNYRAYKKALEEHGFMITREQFKDFSGKIWTDFLPKCIGSNDMELLNDIHEFKKEVYKSCISVARINSILFDIIEVLVRTFYIAIVTTASRQNCMDILGYFNKEKLFDYILSQDEVSAPKPDAEGFIKCMVYFGISCDDTIIFEDSRDGITAALKTGASVYRTVSF
jgi:beta-phosphoglucomutase|tara:strand:+ start:287 stop:844 length:558 start_codon:yes stop_codon:yes gene_type:complete